MIIACVNAEEWNQKNNTVPYTANVLEQYLLHLNSTGVNIITIFQDEIEMDVRGSILLKDGVIVITCGEIKISLD